MKSAINDYLYEKKDQLNRDIDGEYWWFVRDFELKRGSRRQPGQKYDIEKNRPHRRRVNENFMQGFGDGSVGYDFGLNIERRPNSVNMEVDMVAIAGADDNNGGPGAGGSGVGPGAGGGSGTIGGQVNPQPANPTPNTGNNDTNTGAPPTTTTNANGRKTLRKSFHDKPSGFGLQAFFSNFKPSRGNLMYQNESNSSPKTHSAYISVEDGLDGQPDHIAKAPPSKKSRKSRKDSSVPKTTPVKKPTRTRLTSTPCSRDAVDVPIKRMTLRSQSQNAREHKNLCNEIDNAIGNHNKKRKFPSGSDTSKSPEHSTTSSTPSSVLRNDDTHVNDDEVFEEQASPDVNNDSYNGVLEMPFQFDTNDSIEALSLEMEATALDVDDDEKSAIDDNPLDITEIAKRQPNYEIRGQADGADPDPEDVGVDFKLNIVRSVIGKDRIEFPELYRQTLEKLNHVDDQSIKNRPGLFKQIVHDCWLLHFLLFNCEESRQVLDEWRNQAKYVLQRTIKLAEDGMINTEMIKPSLITERSQQTAEGLYVPKTFNSLAYGLTYIQKRNELISKAKTQVEKDQIIRDLMLGLNQTITLDLDGSIMEN